MRIDFFFRLSKLERATKSHTNMLKPFNPDVHVKYIQDLDSKVAKESYEYWLLEHLRINGLYWGLTALATLNRLDELPKEEVISFVLECFDDEKGAFAAFPGHDAHVITTLSALQILLLYDRMDALSDEKANRICEFVLGLQLPDGSFAGDEFGEIDTRFVFVSLYILTILGRTDADVMLRAAAFILECQNFDGGFGMYPGAESHAAQMYTTIGALALCDRLDQVSARTATWLSERQVLPSGGFNGRPEKLPDVCYSWWVLLCLAMLQKMHWVSLEKLEEFILDCQDLQKGGFSDRPDNQTDVFHTCFAIAALALMYPEKYNLKPIDPILCLPQDVADKVQRFRK